VLVVGSLNIDLTSVAPRLPRPGETVIGTEFRVAAGGKGANQAVAAARQGAPVSMVGRLGNDVFARLVRTDLKDAGVDLRHVSSDEHAATGTGHIVVDHAGQNAIVVASGANGNLDPAHLEAAAHLFDSAALLVLQLEIPLAANRAAVREARHRGVPVLLNAAPMDGTADGLIDAADWLVVNEIEAEQLSGERVPTPARAARAAQTMQRPKQRIVVTLGRAGAVLVQEDRVLHVPAPRVDVVDTTAAGDAFVGALAAMVVAGHNDEVALRRAVLAGSLACTKIGAIPSLPTAEAAAAFAHQAA
jgi:ribokinase